MANNKLREIAESFFDEYVSLSKERKAEILKELNAPHRHLEIDLKIKSTINNPDLNSKQKSAIKRKKEKQKHSLYVEECLMPKGFEDGKGEVFALLLPPSIDDTDDSNYIEYHISLVTPAMAYTDIRYFRELNPQSEDKPWWYKEYRPYFYDLSICVHNDDAEWKDFYNRHQEGDWIRANLTPATTESKDITQIGLLRFGGSDTFTYEVSIDFKRQKAIDDGTLPDTRSALVSQLKKTYHDELSKITPTKASDYLDSVLPSSVNRYTVNVLNVGEANCIHIEADNTLSFMFDVGVPFEEYNAPFPDGPRIKNYDYNANTGINKNIGILARYKPRFVLISHWHFDHIAGFIHMCDDGLNCHWIVPELDNKAVKDITCVRIALYFAIHKNLSIIDGGFNSILYNSSNGDIELFRGKDIKKSNGEQDLNAGSIILRIRDTLFAADCMYRHLPDALINILNSFNWLVAPHHGAAVYDDDLNIMTSFKRTAKHAVVCVGNNGFRHPRDNHFEALINNNFDSIYVTGGAKQIQYYSLNINMFSNFKSSNQSVIFTI